MHIFVLIALLAAPPSVAESTQDLLELFAHDPPIAEVQHAAWEAHGVAPETINGYRTTARMRALVPSAVSFGYSHDDTNRSTSGTNQSEYLPVLPGFDPNGPQSSGSHAGVGRALTVGGTVDVGGVIFDPAELQIYSLLDIHKHALHNVTKLYYSRQHLRVMLATAAPAKVHERAWIMLRLQEIDAMLNALTDGFWMKQSKCLAPLGYAEFDERRCPPTAD